MSEWVTGDKVDWEGHAEYFRGHDHFGERQTFIRRNTGGFRWWVPDEQTWRYCHECSVKFRKPKSAGVDADGERWRAIEAELKTFAKNGISFFTSRSDGTSRFFNHRGLDIEFANVKHLDAYLAEPLPEHYEVNGETIALKPGESAECGELVVRRKGESP